MDESLLNHDPWGSPTPRWGRGWSAPPAPSPWRPPHRSRGSDGCRVQCWRLLARVSPAPSVMGHGSIFCIVLYFQYCLLQLMILFSLSAILSIQPFSNPIRSKRFGKFYTRYFSRPVRSYFAYHGSITIHPLNTTFPPLFFHPLIDTNSPLWDNNLSFSNNESSFNLAANITNSPLNDIKLSVNSNVLSFNHNESSVNIFWSK